MMTINFKVKSFQNVDALTNTNFLDAITDIVPNDFFDPTQRPGLIESFDVGSGEPIDTAYWWDEANVLIIVSGGHLYKVTRNYTVTQYTGLTGTVLGTGAVSMTPYRSINSTVNSLYYCSKSGSRIEYITDNSTVRTVVTDADAPTDAINVRFIHEFLVALRKNSQRITWADVGAPTSWPNPLEWIEAATHPDDIIAMEVGWDELVLLGKRSIEFMYQTGDSDSQFEPIPATAYFIILLS